MSKLKELDWIATGKQYVGLREVKGARHNPNIQMMLKYLGAWWTDDETPWCGVFTAYCLKKNGITIPKHWYRALDYKNYGHRLTKPAYGCIAIKTRKGGGHVCFVVGKTKDGRLVCLGGNQNDMVCYAVYKASDFDEFRWYGRGTRPLEGRYDLPVLNVSATKVTEA